MYVPTYIHMGTYIPTNNISKRIYAIADLERHKSDTKCQHQSKGRTKQIALTSATAAAPALCNFQTCHLIAVMQVFREVPNGGGGSARVRGCRSHS